MKKIKEYRMSLMEKDGDTEEKGKLNFLIRSSAYLEVKNYLKKKKVKEEEYENFILNSSSLIFEELINKTEKTNVDSVGVWIIFEDGTQVDNSIDISVLKDIEKYGLEDVKPIQEFFKMTLEK